MEQSEAGAKAILAPRSTSVNARTLLNYPLCRRTGYTASACHEFEVVRRGKTSGRRQGRESNGKSGGNGNGSSDRNGKRNDSENSDVSSKRDVKRR